MVEEFQNRLLQKLCTLCPDFDHWYSTYQYQLSQDDKTILLDTKSIIIQGASEFLLSNFNKIGIIFTETIDDILSDLYSIDRLLTIYEHLHASELFNYLTLHWNDSNIVLEQYNNGLIDLAEVSISFIERVIETLGRPEYILEAYATINDCMISNEAFVIYLQTIANLAKHNQQNTSNTFIIPVHEYTKIVTWMLNNTNMIIKESNKLLQAYRQKLSEDIINQTKVFLDDIATRVFSSVFLFNNAFLQMELSNNKFNIKQIESSILKAYIETNDCFLVYYIRKLLLFSIPLPKLLALIIITKVLSDLNIFSLDTLISFDEIQSIRTRITEIQPSSQDLVDIIVNLLQYLETNIAQKD